MIAEGRVTRVHETPEHVLNPVGSIEDAHDQPLADPLKGIKKHLPSFVVDLVCLLQESVFAEGAVCEGGRIFGKSECRKQSLPAGQVVRIGRRVGNWHGR